MKRYSMVLIALIALSALAYDYRTIHGQQPATRHDVTSGAATPAITETPKGKALVEKLPEGVEGVVLEKGVVKAKPGYKFVKKGNSVMVRKAGSGGFGIGGAWNCNCSAGGGGCETHYDENAMVCRKAGSECSDKCLLTVVVKGLRAQIVQY